MGFSLGDVFDGIKDVGKKIVGGIKDLADASIDFGKKIVDGIGDTFKKLWESDLFKVAVVVVAVYFAWPYIAGEAAVTAGAEAATTAGTALSAGEAAGTTVAYAAPEAGAIGAATAPGVSVPAITTAGAQVAAGAAPAIASPAAQATSKGALQSFLSGEGSLGAVAKSAGEWMGNHEILTAMGLNSLASMMQPGEDEIYKQMMDDRFKAINKRMEGVGDINTSLFREPDQQPTPSTAPQGSALARAEQYIASRTSAPQATPAAAPSAPQTLGVMAPGSMRAPTAIRRAQGTARTA